MKNTASLYRRISSLIIFSFILFTGGIALAQQTVPVGVSAPLTGICAEYGVSIQRGIELAQLEAGEVAKRIKFIFEDNAYDSRKSLDAYRSLKDIHRVAAMYSWGEIPLISVSPLAEKDRMPLLAMSNDDQLARNKKFIINMQLPPETYAAALTPHLKDKGLKSFALIISEDPFTEAMARGFRSQPKIGEKVKVELTVSPDLSDFRSEILKLKKHQFDAIGVYLLPGQVGVFARQVRELGFSSFLFGADSFESSTEFGLSAGALKHSLFTNIGVPEKFLKKIKSHFPAEEKPGFVWDSYLFAKASYEVFGERQPGAPEDVLHKYRTAFGKLSVPVVESKAGMSFTRMPLVLRTFSEAGQVKDYRP